jgi:lysozyme
MANIDNAISIATEFIKKWERLSSSSPTSNRIIKTPTADDTPVYAYYDSLGQVWTIGWGNTYYANGSKVRQGDKITKGEADDMITWEMTQKESEVSKFVDPSNLTNNEYAALLSFAYNAGSYGLKKTAIDESLKNKSRQETANLIKDSVLTAGGNYSQGLKNRRIDESRLFLGEYNELYSLYLRNSGSVNVAVIGILLIVITMYLRRRLKK